MSLTVIRTLLKASFFLFEKWNVLIFNRPQKVQINFYFLIKLCWMFLCYFLKIHDYFNTAMSQSLHFKDLLQGYIFKKEKKWSYSNCKYLYFGAFSDWKSNPIQLLPEYGIVSRLYYAQLLGIIKITYIMQNGMNCVRNKTDLCSNLILPPNSVYCSFAVCHRYSEIMN